MTTYFYILLAVALVSKPTLSARILIDTIDQSSENSIVSNGNKPPEWDDLKLKWGYASSEWDNVFVSMPINEGDAIKEGWVMDKNCSDFIGRRYVKDGDRTVMLIFSIDGSIAGLSTGIPKGLPFGFPSEAVRRLFVDESDFYSITAYFTDIEKVCKKSEPGVSQKIGDKLIIRGSLSRLQVPLDEANVTKIWTKGKCFEKMGMHYWNDVKGSPVTASTSQDDFLPLFLLYDKGKLNGFGWIFSANLRSQHYEKPTSSLIQGMFEEMPNFLGTAATNGYLSTLHIYLNSMSKDIFCS